MDNKFDIKNESFIPEGLEFKPEYLENAMAMYGSAKKKLWWKKFYSGLSTFILLSALIVIPAMKTSKNAEKIELGVGSSNVGADSGIPLEDHRSEKENKNLSISTEDLVEVDLEKIAESSPKEANNDKNIIEKSGISSKTSGQGDSESSGFELPDQVSTREKQDAVLPERSKTKLAKSVNMDDETMNSSGVKAEPQVENFTISDSHKLVMDSDNMKGHEQGLMHTKPADRIEFIPIRTTRREAQLSQARVIPFDQLSKWLAYVSVGFSPIAGFGSNNNQWKPDPMVHAGVSYKIHHGLSVNLSGRYFHISGLSHPYIVESTLFGQGFKTNAETYYTDRLHYAGICAGISKMWHNRHAITLGYNADYLITGANHIVVSERTTFENNILGSRKAKGFVEGFHGLNHSIKLSYEYWLGSNKSIGLNFQYGLTDITKDSYFGEGIVDRNSLLSLYFRMNLTK
jgi:hypothetical protein